MIPKSKLIAILKELNSTLSMDKGNDRNEKLQDVYNTILLPQQTNKEPFLIENELLKIFTEDEKRDYLSSIKPLLLDKNMTNTEIRLLSKNLNNIINRL